jgi:hypothetical protein
MSNVLPIVIRERVAGGLRDRALFLLGLMCSLAALIAIAALMPAYLSVAIPLIGENSGAL